MKNLIAITMTTSLFLSAINSQAGVLVYRSGYLHPGCSITTPNFEPSKMDPYYTLKCNGNVVKRDDWRTTPPVTYFDNINFEQSSSGAISYRSVANVFASRPLDSNYLAFSNEGILDKPIILVEGYDPENATKPTDFHGKGFKKLVTGGRDLFIVNFPNGSANLDSNAQLLKNIIQEINNAKTGTHPTAVIGYSMGGIVARKALKSMEMSGVSHQVSLYISYDAPHMGANLQGSIERTVEKLIDKIDDRSFGYTPSALTRARNLYKSPAAQEMLIGALNYRASESIDFPNNVVRIGVTSGSLNGITQQPSLLDGEQVGYFNMTIEKKVFGITTTLSESSTLYGSRRANIYYDNVPGSYLYQLDDFMYKLADGIKITTYQDHRSPYSRRVTFIPTTSALAMKGLPTTPTINAVKFNSPFDLYIAADRSGRDACVVLNDQTSIGDNILHNPGSGNYDESQLNQINCALTRFHKPGVVIPDRSFKMN